MTAIVTVRRLPVAGEIGCVGACPLCSVPGKSSPPCLACREELRSRLADMQLQYYMQRAMN
ncbi:MAG TPA: hypothetical protein VM370_13680 [Candidatus Thermoplasmatota archaeon]|nr:hypothetical protein [Candidatus Thermoplasmatota archaeon]